MTMASKYILMVDEGEVIKLAITKPQAPRKDIAAWLARATERARRHNRLVGKPVRYAFRFGDLWWIITAPAFGSSYTMRKSFPADAEDAAAMWLLHVEEKAG